MSIDSKLRRGFKVFTLFVNSLNTAVFSNYKTLENSPKKARTLIG